MLLEKGWSCFLQCWFLSQQVTAIRNGIQSMPTFFFYKNRKKVDEMKGADPTGLEDKINQWIGGAVDTVV